MLVTWEAAMAAISSAGNLSIPSPQPTRRQAERSVPAPEESVIKQEKQIQGESDKQSRRASGQDTSERDQSSSPSVTQSSNVKLEVQETAGEQREIEAAQQEAERADFNQQAGISRKDPPNDVRPSSNEQNTEQATVVLQEKENPAIKVFDSLQNVNAAPRQGQSLNQFV